MSGGVEYDIGRRLRARRRLLGLTQTEVAQACGITFQQIQKYEVGVVSMSASRLWALAQVLDVPIGHFFDGLSDGPRGRPRDGLDADHAGPPLS
jgi:transcriptional regulator with XRE-family HTH domain